MRSTISKYCRSISAVALISVLGLNLTGCVPLVIGAGAAATGAAVVDERSVGYIVDDTVIKSKLTARYFKKDVRHDLANVHLRVKEGRVLLTGTVANAQAEQEAVKLAWEVRGVREVISEIQSTDKASVWRTSKDLMIKSQIKSKYLLQKDLRSANYTVIVNHGIVYLFGIAQNKENQMAAMDIASRVRGVKQVVNHVIVKTDHRRYR